MTNTPKTSEESQQRFEEDMKNAFILEWHTWDVQGVDEERIARIFFNAAYEKQQCNVDRLTRENVWFSKEVKQNVNHINKQDEEIETLTSELTTLRAKCEELEKRIKILKDEKSHLKECLTIAAQYIPNPSQHYNSPSLSASYIRDFYKIKLAIG